MNTKGPLCVLSDEDFGGTAQFLAQFHENTDILTTNSGGCTPAPTKPSIRVSALTIACLMFANGY